MSNNISMSFVKLVSYALLVITSGAELCQVNSSTTSPTCNLWHDIEMSLDQTVDPCEDIYRHVCNNYGSHHKRSKFSRAQLQMDKELISVMESQPAPETNSAKQSFLDKTYNYYKSCVNERDTDILRYLELIKPGNDLEWPLMEERQAYRRGDTNFTVSEWPVDRRLDVFALLGQLQSYGLSEVLIYQKLYDAESALIIEVVEFHANFSFSQTKVFSELMKWGLAEETALKYAEDAEDSDKHWYSLYQKYMSDSQPELMTFGRLKRQFPYLSVFLENIYPQQFRDSFRIELYSRRYFEFLRNQQWSGKEAQVVCNYLMIKFLNHLSEDRPGDFSQLECIKELRHKLDLPVNLLYYQYVYKPDESYYNSEMYRFFNKTLHYTMDVLLMENHFKLPTTVLADIRSNISSISLNIGNLPRNLHMSQLEIFFGNIPELDPRNYYTNHLHLLRHRVLKSLLPLKNQTFSIKTAHMDYWTSLPFFDRLLGMLVIPFGVFHPPLYHYSYDPIFKWSQLGSHLAFTVASAVLKHALKSNEGLQLDACIADRMLVDSYRRRVSLVSLVGVHVAYKAYYKEHAGIHLQPEFATNISWKKLFLLNIMQNWCGQKSPDFSLLTIFHDAFQCPVGSKMNPRKKCRLL